MSNRSYSNRLIPAGIIFAIIGLAACDGPNMPTYNGDAEDPFPVYTDPPELLQIIPEAGFPGDEATVIGVGFKADPKQNLINIGTGTADILEISENEARIRVPHNDNGERRVRASVWGSDLWSNELLYKYLDDFFEMGMDAMNPGGVSIDDEGSFYFSSIDDQAVYRVDVLDSTISTYASLPVRGPMEFGPDNRLFVVTTDGLVSIPEGGGSYDVEIAISNLHHFDWHSNGDIYLLHGNSVSRYSNGQLVSGLGAVAQQSTRMRVFDGFVYVAELIRSRVVRFEITGDGLGPLQLYANIGTPLAGLDIDANGNVYASGFIREYVFKIRPDREDDSDVDMIPNEADQANPFRSIEDRVVDIYIHNTVMYLVQNRGSSGQIGKIWRIFIGEPAAPKAGRE